jgi:hypothetical protein
MLDYLVGLIFLLIILIVTLLFILHYKTLGTFWRRVFWSTIICFVFALVILFILFVSVVLDMIQAATTLSTL